MNFELKSLDLAAAAAFIGTSSEDGMEIEAPAPDATIAQGMA